MPRKSPKDDSVPVYPPWWDVFASEYVKTGKKAASYLLALPNTKKATAEVQASRLLRNVNFRKFLKPIQEKSSEKFNLTKDQWLKRISDIAKTAEKDSDRLKAEDMLGRAFGWFEDKLHLTGSVSFQFTESLQDEIADDFKRLSEEIPILKGRNGQS